jgi:hypothetical protein
MKIYFFILLAFVSCSKEKNCPDYANNGCGCYDTGDNSFGTPYTVTNWDETSKKCYWTDRLGNSLEIDKKYCPCRK